MTAITISDLNNAKTDVDHIAAIATSTSLTATDRLGHTKPTMAGAAVIIDAKMDQVEFAKIAALANIDADIDNVESVKSAALANIDADAASVEVAKNTAVGITIPATTTAAISAVNAAKNQALIDIAEKVDATDAALNSAIESLKSFNSRGAWTAVTLYNIKDLASVSGTWYVCVAPHTSSAAFATDIASKWRVYQGVMLGDLALASAAGLVGYDEEQTYADGSVGAELQTIAGPINQVVTCYGDSYTMGASGGITYDQAYVNLIAAAKKWSIPQPPDYGTAGKGSTSVGNQAYGGSQIASTEQIERIMNHVTTDADIQFILTGFNDARAFGLSDSGVSTYRQTLQSALAWMAIAASSTEKHFANSVDAARIVRTGTGWIANTIWFNGRGCHTAVAGDTFNASVFGDVIYIALPRDTTTTGVCTIDVDGVNHGTYDFSGSADTVQYSKIYSMGFVRIAGLPRARHAVTLTKTSANTGTDYMRVDWIAGVDGLQSAHDTNGGPQVYVGNCCRMSSDGYELTAPTWSNADDNVVHGYNTIIEQCVRELAADGMNIVYVDVCKYFDPNSADLAVDGVHPSATGMQKIANAFLERMDAKRVHPKDRGALTGLHAIANKRFSKSSLGVVTEIGDLGNTTNFAGAGAQTSMSHNVKIVDGYYYRINNSQSAWVLALTHNTTGPMLQTAPAGTGRITGWTQIGLTAAGQPAWTTPAFENSWVDQGSWAPTGYMKDGLGFVHLRGLVISGVIASPVFTLPAGYRPVGKMGFPIVSNNVYGWVTITSAGVVTIESGSNVWASLSGIAFQAA